MTTGVRLAFERGHGRRTVPSRSALTAAVLGAAAVIGATAYAASLDRLVTEPVRWGWAWDLMVEVDADRVDEAVAALRDLPEISGVATVSDRQVIVEGRTVRGQSVAVHQGVSARRRPRRKVAGRGPTRSPSARGCRAGSIATIGDTVTVTTPDGSDQFTVVGRVTSFPLDGDGLGDGVLLAPRTLDGVAASDGFDSLALTASEATSEDQLVEAITPLIDDDMVELSTYGYPAPPDEVVNASSLTAVPWALAAFLGALADRRRRSRDLHDGTPAARRPRRVARPRLPARRPACLVAGGTGCASPPWRSPSALRWGSSPAVWRFAS